MENFLLEMGGGGGGLGGWVGFMMGDVKFLKSLYIVGRGGANTPIL